MTCREQSLRLKIAMDAMDVDLAVMGEEELYCKGEGPLIPDTYFLMRTKTTNYYYSRGLPYSVNISAVINHSL